MQDEIESFTPSAMERIAKTVRRVEGMSGDLPDDPLIHHDPLVKVKVTGPVASGLYPGVIVYKMSPTDTNEEGDVVRVVGLNGEELSEDAIYKANLLGVTSDNYLLFETIGGGDGSGSGGGCCGDEIALYHPTDAPFTTTCDIRRPFGAGAATTSGVSCSYWGDFLSSRLSNDAIDWTHVMVVPAGTDIRDGCSRLLGSNALGYADGDEVRIPSGASSPRFVVVFVESVNKGGTNPYYRVFMMRHAP